MPHERVAEYLAYLDKEMTLVAARMGPDRMAVQPHLGGGTAYRPSARSAIRTASPVLRCDLRHPKGLAVRALQRHGVRQIPEAADNINLFKIDQIALGSAQRLFQ